MPFIEKSKFNYHQSEEKLDSKKRLRRVKVSNHLLDPFRNDVANMKLAHSFKTPRKLEMAQSVVKVERKLEDLEPSPIDPRRVLRVVENVHILESRLHRDELLVDFSKYFKDNFPEFGAQKEEVGAINILELNDIEQSPASIPQQVSSANSSVSDISTSTPHSGLTSYKNAEIDINSYHIDRWNERYKELCHFVRKNGHCHVPIKLEENPLLSKWAKRQRYQYKLKKCRKHSTLTDDREDRLGKLGFVWDVHISTWDDRYQELCEFRRNHGHCNVHRSFNENPKLGSWVKCQRRQHSLFRNGKKSSVTPERISKLDALDFEWVGSTAHRGEQCSRKSNGQSEQK
jgi:hypothetical protein